MAHALGLALALMAQAPAAPPSAPAEDGWGFAMALVAERDGYRAIGELKRFAYLHPGARARRAQLLIGRLYLDHGQVDASRFHLRRLIDEGVEPLATSARLLELENVCVARKLLGNCREELAALPASTPLGLAPYLGRYLDVLLGAPAGAPVPVALELKPAALRLEALAVERAALPLKRPWLAGVLSAVLPGAGQVYDGRPVDGALAFLLTGLTGVGAVNLLARAQPEWGFGITLGLLALVFYSGNIVNAVGDAWRLNEAALDGFARTMERDAWPRVRLSAEAGATAMEVKVELPGVGVLPVARDGEGEKAIDAAP